MNKLYCFLVFYMVFYMSVLYSENMELKGINSNLSYSLAVEIASFKQERETFKACESGQLEEYRIWKRRTLDR